MYNSDFVKSSILQKGMFYAVTYSPKVHKPDYDVNPLLFILGPLKTNANYVVALNFHHIGSIDDRCRVLAMLSKFANIQFEDVEISIIGEDECRRLFSFAGDAIRIYDRRRFTDVHRVKSNCVGKYIEYNGNLEMKPPSAIMNKYWLNYSQNTTAEAMKAKRG